MYAFLFIICAIFNIVDETFVYASITDGDSTEI